MTTKNKFFIAGAIAAIILLLMVAFWTLDTRRSIKRIEEKITTIEAAETLEALAYVFGDGDCYGRYDRGIWTNGFPLPSEWEREYRDYTWE